jgi:hypothetical protein
MIEERGAEAILGANPTSHIGGTGSQLGTDSRTNSSLGNSSTLPAPVPPPDPAEIDHLLGNLYVLPTERSVIAS